MITSETVEKVPKQIHGRDAEKNDLTECATISDLTITRGHETPKKHPLTILKGFSTVSVESKHKETIRKKEPSLACLDS
jgi:hypothetical protein